MTGESQREPSSPPDPTVVTTQNIDKEITHLRELIESTLAERELRYMERFKAQELAVKSAFASSEKAVDKAEKSIEKRADATYVSVQELANSLSKLMPRTEAVALIGALAEKVAAADKKADRLEALKDGTAEQRTDTRFNTGTLIAVGSLFLTILIVTIAAANFLAR